MKKLFFLFSIALISFSSYAQTATSGQTILTGVKTGDILDLKETEFDFGKIPQGKPVTHIFHVANTGKDSLKIANVQASCGCTTPEWDRDKVVAPGEGTDITVGYNAANDGPFTKFITITYNDNKTKQITIKGEVWKTPTSSAPANNDLDNLKD
ncbi:DUF1573 domain-containing protein [Ferruginibacter albus]|uniref:DUF1573 domain-containing protein n=1 Tax=Ferruginibacter albus TaxID=2875540 RepID=UPI001CC41110|nr:DUF1573 domain-containing protein [Ferruginibacter albus]UAY51402.1 DUF1573 domain-containing protein [Ferruginibacter albus]